MKYQIKNIATCLFAACLSLSSSLIARPVTVFVKNTSSLSRQGEMIELNASNVKQKVGNTFIVTYKGKQLPYQITYDGKLIFQVDIPAKSSATYIIKVGKPAAFEVKTTGRLHPERKDDMAWENDRIAYRCYGPALQQSGERGYGNDVWLKRTSKLVCDFRYGQEARGYAPIEALRKEGKKKEAQHYSDSISYHIDHGTGLDNYDVGPTLGCGATAFLLDNQLIYPWCFSKYEVLDNGPLRFTVKLSYPVAFDESQKMTEVRVISLDAGSQLNKAVVSYQNQKMSLPVVAGLVMHKGSDDYNTSMADGFAGYAEKVKGNDGQTFVGLVFPNRVQYMQVLPLGHKEKAAKASGAEGHLIGGVQLAMGASFVYYWGAGWSKYGFAGSQEWYQYLKEFAAKLKQPLQIVLK